MAALLRRTLLGFWLLSTPAIFLTALPARADEASDPKTEARERFGRGLRLFNDGDNAGALAEFKRAYEISPHPVVAYNIGLVYAAMGRAVEAVATLDELLKNPGSLASDKLDKAKRTREEQAQRIAELDVKVNVAGAQLEIDGLRVEKLPLTKPVKVTSGSRIVSVSAPGHVPERREITLAGGTKQSLVFELTPFEGRLARVTVRSRIPGARVFVDGKLAGTTPLPAPLVVAPGKHEISVRRAGYASAKQTLELGEAVQGEVTLEPQPDASALGSEGGLLALDASEPDVSVSIDGELRGKYVTALRVPAGPHALRVERDGFEPVERSVEVAKGGTTTLRVALEPRPEYRQRYESKARAFRTWGWVGVIGGAVMAGGGVGYLVWNKGKKDDLLAEAQSWQDEIDKLGAKQPSKCNSVNGGVGPDECNRRKLLALDDYDTAKSRDLYGWLGVGAGVAAVATGSILLLSGDDPDRYTHERPELAKLRVAPVVAFGRGQGSLGLIGTF